MNTKAKTHRPRSAKTQKSHGGHTHVHERKSYVQSRPEQETIVVFHFASEW